MTAPARQACGRQKSSLAACNMQPTQPPDTVPEPVSQALPYARTARKLYLAAYDVCDPKRLAAALKLVRGYASGGQKSAHEIHLTDAEREQLLQAMRRLLNASTDAFVLIRLDPRAKVEALGRAIAPSDAACLYFG